MTKLVALDPVFARSGMKSRPVCWVSLRCCALLISIIIPTASALGYQRALIGIRFMRAVNFVGGLEQVAAMARVPLHVQWQPFQSVRLSYGIGISSGLFINGGGVNHPFISIGPTLTCSAPGAHGWYVTFASSPTLIGGSEFRDQRRLGGSFFFTTSFTLGWRFYHWRTGLRFQHTSNANLGSTNPGVNMVGLVVAETW